MLEINFTGKFKKDYKVCKKRGYNIALLQNVIDTLSIPDALPKKNKDHSLFGSYVDKRECHIQPDWLLIYKQTENELILYRTGTHADLFDM
ncbi:type II toxin-antitoxin system YafQ family toxin [Enterocloster citroniae]|uniref:type II toxin-antitoxin system YafQ family toxin n=1 Tax=Enterocloster citroniae TaxID=358743 RepID=UPI001D0602DF|nr:type II toxin-antitoxin system YafQ family toxin [Enterocloster citroniae]MCB7062222.1 type II toxin-antitoxin system YafQ family toxin [Enterocloster citroniae]